MKITRERLIEDAKHLAECTELKCDGRYPDYSECYVAQLAQAYLDLHARAQRLLTVLRHSPCRHYADQKHCETCDEINAFDSGENP